ncbi:MAG: 3-methylcrotonyl-CoA carboxylase [Sinobacteraceae bacterium]|nr:3-methylcrotonyl-CoA carboxylase [Nevskiaceae bacterium]
MIDTLLVANRGEIACRIFRTARRLGIRTVAVFSEADAQARHVREADEAVLLGPAPPAQSYLNIPRILAAARQCGAQAIHPGYGFLSENADFARACADAGVVFVGPPAEAIAAMGSKIVAKARMRRAGVPVLPGYEGEQQDLGHLQAAAGRLGLPLIIKPAAGGGGKGMRIVTAPGELAEALAGARRLAASAFGSEALLLERYLAAPRHIEVQIFADQHGNFVHLFERDCSIQRRHQKLLEEAPAPELPEDVRARLRSAALLVAREIGYVSAGTVEFLFDGGEFYFMEMNTRLQVEHTVTEAVTGLDLVEWQLRVASGQPLPLQQAQIQCHGHAIEARVCAEDPERDFLPSAGRLKLLEWPTARARVDAGFESGDEVPANYDSLLGKIIACGATRDLARQSLIGALQHTYCAGVHTNERWLSRVLASDDFAAVRHSIAFLAQHAEEFRHSGQAPAEIVALAALAVLAETRSGTSCDPWAATDGFIPNLGSSTELKLTRAGQIAAVRIVHQHGRAASLEVQVPEGPRGRPLQLSDASSRDGIVAAVIDGRRHQLRYLCEGERIHLWDGAAHYEFHLDDPRRQQFSASSSAGGLTTPLPGVVAAVKVSIGQQVSAGEVLMVIEAMKMEHSIAAPYDGTVAAIGFTAGDRVPEGSQLLELTPQEQKTPAG